MALPSRYSIEKKINSMEGLSAYENGGKGSGNFGHSGRPGEVGGSGDGKGAESNIDELKKSYEKAEEELDRLSDKLADAEDELEMAKEDDNTSYASDMKKRIDELSHQIDIARGHRDEAYDKLSQAKSSQKESRSISLKGKSLYEKVHMIEPGDEVHITPKDNLPNFDRKIKVDYIQDGTIHYGSSETSDGYTYPAWAIKDITKIVRKKKNSIYAEASKRLDEIEKKLNGGKGSGNFGHAGRPGEVGGSSSGGLSGISKAIATQKKFQDQAKIVQEDIEDRIGQKVKKGEEYTVWDEASTSRFKFFHGEDGTEYTYDKGNGMITKTNPKTGDQEVVTKQKKDYGSEKSDLVSNEGSNLGVTRKDFEIAKQVAKERAGKMSIYEDMNDGLYHAKDNFYDRKFDTKKGVVAFKSGYDDGDKASSFDQLDYTKRQTKSGNSRYDISYKGTDKSYGKSFNNPIEAQYYTEGYNSKIRAIESEVPSEAWKKIKK